MSRLFNRIKAALAYVMVINRFGGISKPNVSCLHIMMYALSTQLSLCSAKLLY
jgi:hypothetical protein